MSCFGTEVADWCRTDQEWESKDSLQQNWNGGEKRCQVTSRDGDHRSDMIGKGVVSK